MFERHALANTTVDAQLDTPMLSKLPEKWRFQWRGRNLERITYRHLLQHTSGFRDASCGGKALQPLEQLAAGVQIADVGTLRCYNNFNFYLMRYLIVGIAYPGEAAAIHKKHASLSLEDDTKNVNIETSLQYERFLRDELFPRAEHRFVATCRPQKELAAREAAKGYANKDDATGAFVHSRAEELDDQFYCASQGSWYSSAEGLAQFGRTLLYTDRWVSPSTRRMMFDDARADDEFPWVNTVVNDAFGKEMGSRSGRVTADRKAAFAPRSSNCRTATSAPRCQKTRGTRQQIQRILDTAAAALKPLAPKPVLTPWNQAAM